MFEDATLAEGLVVSLLLGPAVDIDSSLHSLTRAGLVPVAMGKKKPPGANVKKFGAPLYASAWADHRCLIVAGGGGKRSSGIPNRVVVATFDGATLTEPLHLAHTD